MLRHVIWVFRNLLKVRCFLSIWAMKMCSTILIHLHFYCDPSDFASYSVFLFRFSRDILRPSSSSGLCLIVKFLLFDEINIKTVSKWCVLKLILNSTFNAIPTQSLIPFTYLYQFICFADWLLTFQNSCLESCAHVSSSFLYKAISRCIFGKIQFLWLLFWPALFRLFLSKYSPTFSLKFLFFICFRFFLFFHFKLDFQNLALWMFMIYF